MATLRELIYNLKNVLSGGAGVDDTDISDRQIAFMIGYTRSKLIKEYLQKGYAITANMVQTLPCIEMVVVDKAECCDIKTDCLLLRSKDKIPTVLQWNGMFGFKFIGTLDRQEFTMSSEAQINWLEFRKYSKKGRYAYYRNGYLYLTNDLLITRMTIDAVFEDPTELEVTTTCSGEPCWNWDSEYPLPEFMIDNLNSILLTKELTILKRGIPDTTNDAKDNTTPAQ